MASSIPEAIMPPIFSSCNFLVDVPLSSSTLPRWRQVRVQAEGLHFSLQGAVILSQTTAINDGLPQLLFPVWSESNHRMTSMWWWVLCKVPPKVTRPAEVFSVRCQITRCNVFFAPVRCDLKEAKPKTFIRFWCQMLTNRDYLMTHLNCHLQYICCWALSQKATPLALSALTQLETPYLTADLILSYDLMSRAVSQTTVSGVWQDRSIQCTKD